MDKQKLYDDFEKNVAYLRKNIPPDDIYCLAEQTFMAAVFFMQRWNDWCDIEQEMKDNPIADKWVNNILGFYLARLENKDIQLDLSLNNIDDDENSY